MAAGRFAWQPDPGLFAAYIHEQVRKMSALRDDISAPGSDRDLARRVERTRMAHGNG
jgi:hypothetical protein